MKQGSSHFPDQDLNPRPLQWKHSLNHRTAGEVAIKVLNVILVIFKITFVKF